MKNLFLMVAIAFTLGACGNTKKAVEGATKYPTGYHIQGETDHQEPTATVILDSTTIGFSPSVRPDQSTISTPTKKEVRQEKRAEKKREKQNRKDKRTQATRDFKLAKLELKEDAKTDRKQVVQDGRTDRKQVVQDGRTDRKQVVQDAKTDRSGNGWFSEMFTPIRNFGFFRWLLIVMFVFLILYFLTRKK